MALRPAEDRAPPVPVAASAKRSVAIDGTATHDPAFVVSIVESTLSASLLTDDRVEQAQPSARREAERYRLPPGETGVDWSCIPGRLGSWAVVTCERCSLPSLCVDSAWRCSEWHIPRMPPPCRPTPGPGPAPSPVGVMAGRSGPTGWEDWRQ